MSESSPTAAVREGMESSGIGSSVNPVKVFVGNLDFKVTKEDLERMFSPHGTVVGVNVRTDRNTGKPRGFAFVTFAEPAEAQAAVDSMHGSSHSGRTLTVNFADVRGNADKGTAKVVKPAYMTVPDARPKQEAPSSVFATPGVVDYSVVATKQNASANAANKKKKNIKNNKKTEGGGAAAQPAVKSWTSWAGP